MKKITVVTGHFGSGKTNLSVNLALLLAKNGEKVTVCDLDIVNPYFRSADFAVLFKNHGISLAAPKFANTNLDIPAISFDLERLADGEGCLIADVGGDEDGAIALGRFSSGFNAIAENVEMLYVVNMYRYLTGTPEDAVRFMHEISNAAKMKHTAIVNNSNLGEETTDETVEKSVGYADEICRLTGLPLKYTTVPINSSAKVPNPLEVGVFVRKIWDEPAE